MIKVSEKAKLIYLVILIIFILSAGFFWLDYIGLVNMDKYLGRYFRREAPLALEAKDDEPSLVEREEFEKEKQKFQERIEDLDRREAQIVVEEKNLDGDKEKLEEMKKGLQVERKKLENEKKQYSGYKRNVMDLARKIESIQPEEAIQIMVKWEEPLIIDVLRQIDANAEEAGRMSVSSYLIQLISEKVSKEKASRIMYLMTQL